ncbi:MAG: arginine repressor [Lachnospiraceae bacterium]|nr:arginine repressor [Lachnospiraceae bacterium]
MKDSRHQKILELIGALEIETQEELAEKLRESGFPVTQATVSRDIRQLRLTKVPTSGGRQKYAAIPAGDALPEERYVRVFCEGFAGMDAAQNILVVRTASGLAMAVAAALDAMRFPEVVGTLAGDDTLICIARTSDDVLLLMNKIKRLLGAAER